MLFRSTSPRKTGIPQEDADWEVGTAAGFYLDATRQPWASRFNMYSHVTRELPELVGEHFPARLDREGIFGHSMLASSITTRPSMLFVSIKSTTDWSAAPSDIHTIGLLISLASLRTDNVV